VTGLLAAIPYSSFPDIGPFKTFGLAVGLGVLIGAVVAAHYCERWGVSRDTSYTLATKLVLAGVIGARLTWDITHWNEISSPLDLIAVWNGGLQFSGGFIFAVLAGIPTFRKWDRLTRWHVIDGYSMGLAIGLAFGRIGCTSVGEHFGNQTDFFLATRYDGGVVREPVLYEHATIANPVKGHTHPIPLVKGMVFHNTAIYELIFLLVLFAILWVVLHKKPAVAAGTGIGIFCLYYGFARFGTDLLRVNDKLKFGLTGAQWMCIVLIPAALWILFKVRPATAKLAAQAAAEADAEPEAEPEPAEPADPDAS
jgi:phosphatidylglycerol:prolipoprotein diacylglycerol transferase